MRPAFLWEKKGLVFAPDGRHEWMVSHAQNPSVLVLEDRLRIYFACRGTKDAYGCYAAVGTFVEVDRSDPGSLLYVHDRPLLPLGGRGTFDQFGVMPASPVRVGQEIWMYYVGWSRCQGVPYHHAIGVAVSSDGGATFRRLGTGPVMDRSLKEPFIHNSPYVSTANGMFHMWYSAGTGWVEDGGRPESVYILMHAASSNGVDWVRESVPLVSPVVDYECQTNPSVMRIGDMYHMWFCYRSGVDFRNAERGYRIGYAWSKDLSLWQRDDPKGELAPSQSGWDSEMVCYPRVLEVDGRILMFYSGNYFGRDGFGYAVCLGKGGADK